MKFLGRGLQVLALIFMVGIFASSAVAVRVGTGSSYGTDQSTTVIFSGSEFNEQEVSVTGGDLFLFQISDPSLTNFSLILNSLDQFAYWGILQQNMCDSSNPNCMPAGTNGSSCNQFDSNCISFSNDTSVFYTGITNPCYGGSTGLGQSADPGTFTNANPQSSVTFTAANLAAGCTSSSNGSLTLFVLDNTQDPNTGNYIGAPVDACLTSGSSTSCNTGTTAAPEPSSRALLLVGVVGLFLVFHLAQRKANYQTAAI
ncbi:MAG: hypothetical protein ABSG69_16415 [Candidatus Acidiferrum sp.]|jgi:hypothetical protein